MSGNDSKRYRTPGVYITELDAFPASIVGVPTAVPAFVGYTASARTNGRTVRGEPIQVRSLADFEAVFGGPFPPTYTIAATDGDDFDFRIPDDGGEGRYQLHRVAAPRFLLHASMALFYANGGGVAYVVSVGDYAAGIVREDLIAGLDALANLSGPTLLAIPDAVSLASGDDFTAVSQAMLAQAVELQDRVAILDVFGAGTVTAKTLDATIAAFRNGVVDAQPSFGAAYFPFLNTSVVTSAGFDYRNFADPASATPPDVPLKSLLERAAANLYGPGTPRLAQVEGDIATLTDVSAEPEARESANQNLVAALPVYTDMLRVMADDASVLPPSGAMAGAYTRVDANRGVWNAPANVVLTSVTAPTFVLNDDQQGELNVPVDGKAINAIRAFVGRGNVVWGARTLDGNSNDFRYIQVRRTLIYIEQSIKAALQPFTFATNDGKTWTQVVGMISAFLQGLWAQGGLMGATANEAFSVQCGLGSTMTGQDILDGYLIVQVTLQMIRPAEFIELTFKQKMEGVS